jgi:hypothetical protein
MSLLERSGGKTAVPTRSQAALDNMNFKIFWSRPLEQRGWTTAQQKKSFKHRLSNQVGLQVQRWGKWCIE